MFLLPEHWVLVYENFCTLLRQEYIEKFTLTSLQRICPTPNFMTNHITCLRNKSYQQYMSSPTIRAATVGKNKTTKQYEYQGNEGREKHSYFCNLMRTRVERDKYKRPVVGQEITRYLRYSTTYWLLRQLLPQ